MEFFGTRNFPTFSLISPKFRIFIFQFFADFPSFSNFFFSQAGVDRQIKNFGKDISDSEIYTHLIHQIAPKDRGVNKKALQTQDLLERANTTLDQADKLDCRSFVSPQDIVSGVEKLNLAFVANLFNNFPALEEPEEGPEIVETREEKSKFQSIYRFFTPLVLYAKQLPCAAHLGFTLNQI